MQQSIDIVLKNYVSAYRRLYNRTPHNIETIDHNWVMINGARMRLTDLEYLTEQLEFEYQNSMQTNRKSVINRLIKWFSN
ncbi:hypothetical protein MASR2M15_27080 [Anaerolineales bacterium]